MDVHDADRVIGFPANGDGVAPHDIHGFLARMSLHHRSLASEQALRGEIYFVSAVVLSKAPVLKKLVAVEKGVYSNLGAIIRSAAAFGIDTLLLSEDCADIYNSKTVRASMGTLFGQRIVRVPNLVDAITALRGQGRRVFAAALDHKAMRLGSFSPAVGDCVVIGNEGHGLCDTTVQACDASVYIPMTDRAESLNAAVAAAILMWAAFTAALALHT